MGFKAGNETPETHTAYYIHIEPERRKMSLKGTVETYKTTIELIYARNLLEAAIGNF